jgi:LAO/AO transport system kinase
MLTGAGDELQGIKRGILELADVVAVNKADGSNAAAAAHVRSELERALELVRPPGDDGWQPRVVTTSGQSGSGLDELWAIIEEHRTELSASGELERRRRRQLLSWLWSLVDEGLRLAVREHPRVAACLPGLEADVLEGRTTPTAAAERVLEAFVGGTGRVKGEE